MATPKTLTEAQQTKVASWTSTAVRSILILLGLVQTKEGKDVVHKLAPKAEKQLAPPVTECFRGYLLAQIAGRNTLPSMAVTTLEAVVAGIVEFLDLGTPPTREALYRVLDSACSREVKPRGKEAGSGTGWHLLWIARCWAPAAQEVLDSLPDDQKESILGAIRTKAGSEEKWCKEQAEKRAQQLKAKKAAK